MSVDGSFLDQHDLILLKTPMGWYGCARGPSHPWRGPDAENGITRFHRSYEPLRHPIRPGLALASCQLILTAITAGASRVASGPFACMPLPVLRQVR
jgi:hypothetical protein